MARSASGRPVSSQSWDGVANWYSGWVGKDGSIYHRRILVPAVLALLSPEAGESVLDIGCGPGVLAPHIDAAGCLYTGVDKSSRLISAARRNHGRRGRFLTGDATRLDSLAGLDRAGFDAAIFMMSIQDISPLDAALHSAAAVLRGRSRMVIVMAHPCFRVPRQSGWGFDAGRRLQFRRVDRYLSALEVPMKAYTDGRGTTLSYHRPLEAYVNGLAAERFVVEKICEIAAEDVNATTLRKEERAAFREIPMFLALRASRR
jgi:SAM-dependent methyltransferase